MTCYEVYSLLASTSRALSSYSFWHVLRYLFEYLITKARYQGLISGPHWSAACNPAIALIQG